VARLKGLPSFLLIVVVVLGLLRVAHVAIPLIFADTRPGPFVLRSLDDVQPRLGFAPLVPGYRPAALGEAPAHLTGALLPLRNVRMVWRGERYLAISERRGGAVPAHPPTSRPLTNVSESLWWSDEGVHHLILRRGDLWVELETDLPSGDLRRLADTLDTYRARAGRASGN
jgi:hypothetical protein